MTKSRNLVTTDKQGTMIESASYSAQMHRGIRYQSSMGSSRDSILRKRFTAALINTFMISLGIIGSNKIRRAVLVQKQLRADNDKLSDRRRQVFWQPAEPHV